MSYTFTASEQQQIQSALAQCTGLTWSGVDYVAVDSAGTNVLPFYTTLSNLLGQKLANPEAYDAATLADLNNAKLWMDVAIGANGGTGMHSAFIRTYTAEQFELRVGRPPSANEMQTASNVVARNFANSLLKGDTSDPGDPLAPWTVPRIDQIAGIDAKAIGEALYRDALGLDDTATSRNAGWAGTFGFSLLGGSSPYETWRLTSAGDAQSELPRMHHLAQPNTLDDFKNLLFAVHSYNKALLAGYAQGGTDFLLTLGYPLAGLYGAQIGATIPNPVAAIVAQLNIAFASGNVWGLVKDVAARSPAISSAVNLIADVGSEKFLDLLMGTLQGKALLGSTTEANFASRARAFFDAYPPSELQSLGMELLDQSGILSLESRAKTDFGAFLALRALSPLVATGEQTLADLKQTHSTLAAEWQADMNARLYGDQDYAYSFTEQWYQDRTRLLTALKKGDFEKTGWVNDAAAPADRDLVFHHVVDGQPVENILGFSRDGTSRADQEIFFGGDGNDVINGSLNTVFGDRIYGGAGNDTIKGLGGTDYIEGNAGNDRLEGGDGADQLLGGAGDDTLVGGANKDKLQGGLGTDRYEFSGDFGEDQIIDSDGTGSIWIDGVQLTGGKKIAGLSNSWISDDKRWRYELGSNGDLLIRHADGSAGSVMLRGWQNGGGDRLGITLPVDTAPVTAAPTLRTYLGDQAAPLSVDGAGVSVYDWGATSWQVNGTLTGGTTQAGFADVIKVHEIDMFTDARVDGFGGNDALGGGDGNDTIEGGEGDDLIAGGRGSNVLRGGAGNDYISATAYVNADRRALPGESWNGAPAGATMLSSGPTWGVYDEPVKGQTWFGVGMVLTDVTVGSVIDAGDGHDGALGSWAADTIYMGAGNDTAHGLAGRDVIYGEGGDDRLYGDGIEDPGHLNTVPAEQHGDDLIDGGTGNDSIRGDGGADVLLGGDGDDVIDGDGEVAVAYQGDDYISGGLGQDSLRGNGGKDILDGGAGLDSLFGGLGDDLVLGGADADQLQGDDGAVTAEDGDDVLRGEDGNDTLIGNGGHDQLLGGTGNDDMQGDNGPATALDGNDWLDGGDGDDYMSGGGGRDTLWGGSGADLLVGDSGETTAFDGADSMDGGAGNDTLSGGGGADTLQGGDGSDILMGDNGPENAFNGADQLDGGNGNDALYGQGGNDVLKGDVGDDSLVGGGGNDTLTGGAGVDYLMGDAGDDTYIFQAGDSALNALRQTDIVDDVQGTNTIRLEGINSSDVLVTAQYDQHLVLQWAGSNAVVMLDGVNAPSNRYVFADGVSLDRNGLIGRLSDVSMTGTNPDGTRRMMGGRQADSLVANRTGDVVSGGRGGDTIWMSGPGGYTYLYQSGDGADVVIDSSAKVDASGNAIVNRMIFGEGISQSEIRVTGYNSHLRLVIGGNAQDTITFADFDVGGAAPSPIGLFEFDDGSSLTYAQLVSRGFVGDGTDEYIEGTRYGDHISGGGGNDVLIGRGGDDVYSFGWGSGRDEVQNSIGYDDYLIAGVDVLGLGDSITSADVELVREFGYEGDSLRINLIGSDDSVLLVGYFGAGDSSPSFLIRFSDGLVWGLEEVMQRMPKATDGADKIHGTYLSNQLLGLGGDDTVFGYSGDDWIEGGAGNDYLASGSGNDSIYGGEGNDYLISDGDGVTLFDGGSGNDTLLAYGDGSSRFVFGRGYGQDLVGKQELGSPVDDSEVAARPEGVKDYVLLSGALNPSDLYISRQTNALEIKIKDSSDSLVVEDFFNGDWIGSGFIDGLVFSDGSVFSHLDLKNIVLVGGDGDDRIYGYSGADVLSGNAGDDGLHGGDGNDSLDGGLGDDYLNGGAGSDTYLYSLGSGSDVIDNAHIDPEGADVDTIRIGSGLDSGDVRLVRDDEDLYLLFEDGGFLQIENHFGAPYYDWTYAIDGVHFADGSYWARSELDAATHVQILRGSDGADTLVGVGGAELMIGGAGDDTYVVGTGDSILESAGGGTDTVQSAITWNLDPNVEHLTLTDTEAIDGTGNALNNRLEGNSGNNHLDGGAGNDTLTGGTGNDTYYVDSASDVTTEAASAGTDTVVSSVSWTLGTNLENLTLGGMANVNGTGNTVANRITGNAGNNLLSGGAGSDTMLGGAGNDTYVVDATTDVVTENLNEGVDLVQALVTYTLGVNVENLTLTGTGTINGTGNSMDNVLTGNSAANVLTGGAGNDTYVVGSGDTTVEAANGGTDTVQSSITWNTLATNVENLTLTGTGAINGTGNTLNNVLTGNGAVNTLSGGAGADTMQGGLGNDTYVVDNVGDVVIEAAGEGSDLVQSIVSYTLSSNVENLTLTGTGAISGTGNASDNVLTGNSGANVLTGGAGNDTYVAGTGDTTVEAINGGIDTVQSSITRTLAANVENLVLTGTGAINGTGNEMDNVLTGNSAANVLTGGAGNDTYVVGSGDTTVEAANGGTDTVQSSITWNTLATNVENLTLTGTGAINGTGNTLNNVLTGNSAVNTLSGGAGNDTLDGGAGADSLVGGAGNDTYWLGRGYGIDTITENDATAGNTDIARFHTGIAVDQLWFAQSGNNLNVSIIGTTDRFTLTNWYLGSQYRVEQFQTSDGKRMLDSQVQNLVSAMAAFTPPPVGQTSLSTSQAASLSPVIAANWQ